MLPVWACVLALAAAVLVPTSVALGVGDDARTAPYATWYLGGIGALMAIVMARRRVWVAWSGIAILAVASIPLDGRARGDVARARGVDHVGRGGTAAGALDGSRCP